VVILVGYIASLFFPKPVLDRNLLYSGLKPSK
jgi:SSS family solute:Na+ symporter